MLSSKSFDNSMIPCQSAMIGFRSIRDKSTVIVDSLPLVFTIIGAFITGAIVMLIIMLVVFLSSVIEVICSAVRRTIDHHHSMFVKYISANELQKSRYSSTLH